MRCSRCNAEIKSNEKFCFNCGSKIEDTMIDSTNTINLKKKNDNNMENENNININNDTTPNHLSEKTSKKAGAKTKLLTKVKKLLIATISLLFIAGIGILLIPQTQAKVVNQFEEAIINNEPEKLKKIIISGDKRLEITKENLEPIISYYNDNPSSLNNDVSYLKNAYPGENSEDNEKPFTITTKKVIFKEKYYIKLNPKYIQIDNSYKDAKISMYCNEKLVEENISSGEVGPLVPGKYKFVISYENEYSKSQASKEIDIFYGQLKNNVDLSDTINKNTIISEEEDAIIYINNKSTNKKAKELSEVIGLKNGDTVYGVFKNKNEDIRSNVVQISGSSEIHLSYEYTKSPSTDEMRNNVSELIYNYLYNFAYAVNYNDFSYIEGYMSIGSNLYNTQKTNVPKFYEKGIKESYINHEIIDINYDEGEGTGSITVKEVYEIGSRDKDTDMFTYKEKTYKNKYYFIFNEIEGTYKLTDLVQY